jgi:hypothetical protein
VIRIYEADPTDRVVTPVGCAYARMGRREAPEKSADKVVGGEGGASIFACLGEKDGSVAIVAGRFGRAIP